jgi:FkbM family methyltransferase
MRSVSNFFAEALWFGCESDRIIDGFLYANGCRRRFHSTKSQDRWVVTKALKARRNGFFVEVGAADGRTHSNTYILERDYDWTGIVVEANPEYLPALRHNRKCLCVQSCVDATSGEIDFYCRGFLGGIIDHDTDNARHKRGALIDAHRDRIVRLKTFSLQQLLEAHDAPPSIDYLSLDVEGAEHRILSTFPFDRFRFECLTVERPTRAIHALLQQAGYILDRIYRFDGFYVSRDLAARLGIGVLPFEGMAPKRF